MKRISSRAELESLRTSALQRRKDGNVVIRVCNTGCRARKSVEVIAELEGVIEK
ncbi:hypothetical protein LCGC14_2813940, partial [marine sediment metagenome]